MEKGKGKREKGKGKRERGKGGRYIRRMLQSGTGNGGAPLFWRTSAGPVVDRQAALAHLERNDPVLGALIRRIGPFPLASPGRVTPFQYLLRCIASQQLSGKAAETIFGRFRASYHPHRPDRYPTPAAVLATSPARLREAGLSGAKAAAILDLARHAANGGVPGRARLERMEAEEIIERLTAVRGIGRWTVEMLLIFYLGHPDVLPTVDLGIRKGFARLYGRRHLPSELALTRHGRRWQPYRSVACWYLWRVLELPPD
jgi:3-methyladenine DNA glycosylase/8-oxoguanine DNA glycosylase